MALSTAHARNEGSGVGGVEVPQECSDRNRHFASVLAMSLLPGCYDSVEAPFGYSSGLNGEKAHLVQRARLMMENGPALCLPDMHKSCMESQPSVRKKTASLGSGMGIEVDWNHFRLTSDRDLQMVIFPIKSKKQPTAFTSLQMGLDKQERMNKVTSKLLVRQNEDQTLTGVVMTYIYDQQYEKEFGEELDDLAYDFTDSHFTGYFITSRTDGTILLGRRIEDGKDVFSFRPKPAVATMQESAEASGGEYIHLFLCLNPGNEFSRTSFSLGAEGDTGLKCSFCGKNMDACTCWQITVCTKCGQKIVNGKCGCTDETDEDRDDGMICPICNNVITNSECLCCSLCHFYPCICDISSGGGGSNPSTGGGGGGSGSSTDGGSSTGDGSSIGGGSGTSGTQAAIPGTEAVKSATQDAVATVITRYGYEKAACNVGVQAAFKNIFGSSNLPPGMTGNANETTKAWKNNPKYWQPISLSEAQDYANRGYFVVAGYIGPNNSSGHVVVIVPGSPKKSSSWGCYVPATMDTGSGKRWDYGHLNESYGSKKKNYVTYYYYKR